MRVLKITNMYPTTDRPHFGIFVKQETESLRRLGVDVDVLFMDGAASKAAYVSGFRRYWKQLREREYDLVHAHYIFAGIIALSRRPCPIVLTHHGAEVFETWQAPVCRLFTRWFDSVIVRTEQMRTKLGVSRAHVIPGGLDFELFRPRPIPEVRRQLGLPEDKRLVLWAGVDRPDKRFDLALEAMQKLARRVPDAELVKLSGKPHHLVAQYMSACDVLLLTSDSEGSPNVVKEAMASDLPVVGTAVGDVPELIEGTDGCHVTSQDTDDIAAKLELALTRGRRTNGREAVAHLALESISRRIMTVYDDTLAAAGRRNVRITATPGS